jgi:hypothetical protein
MDEEHVASYAAHLEDDLLDSNDFLDHVRQNAQSLAAVRGGKPFWVSGQRCYDWVEYDSVLHDDIIS